MSEAISPFVKMMRGARAGFAATVPMTLFMRSAWKWLPEEEQYALPPRMITREVLGQRRFWQLSPGKQTAVTLMLHFLFGAATGSIYGLVVDRIPISTSLKGPLAGITVWTLSYLGWIPAAGILPPATRHPWRRNVLMIIAHLIWGMTLGSLTRGTKTKITYIEIG